MLTALSPSIGSGNGIRWTPSATVHAPGADQCSPESGEMAVAYWMVHAPRSFFPILNGGDAAILYCFVFLLLVFAGPGVWSIDGALARGDRR